VDIFLFKLVIFLVRYRISIWQMKDFHFSQTKRKTNSYLGLTATRRNNVVRLLAENVFSVFFLQHQS